MLNKAINLILLLTLVMCQSQRKIEDGYEFYIVILYDTNNKIITEGYIHMLSNDLIVNDISLYEWDSQEKEGMHKIPKNGLFKIRNSTIDMYNKSKLDSISIVYRCDRGIGIQYRIPLDIDTTRLYNITKCTR